MQLEKNVIMELRTNEENPKLEYIVHNMMGSPLGPNDPGFYVHRRSPRQHQRVDIDPKLKKEIAAMMDKALNSSSVHSVLCRACFGEGRDPNSPDYFCQGCKGRGVISGDSQFKAELAMGCPCDVEIKPTGTGMGLGTYSRQSIKEGQTVIEYVGEIISLEEADARSISYNLQGLFFMIEAKQPSHKEVIIWVIDPTRKVRLDPTQCDTHLTDDAIHILCHRDENDA